MKSTCSYVNGNMAEPRFTVASIIEPPRNLGHPVIITNDHCKLYTTSLANTLTSIQDTSI